MRWPRQLCALLATLVILTAGVAAHALAKPRSHRVVKRQTLGMIAKRYNVSVAAICEANDIRRRDPLKPGRRLLIPLRTDRDGKQARKYHALVVAARSKTPGKPRKKSAKKASRHRWHKVYKGQRLGSIAKRYQVSLKALRHANALGRRDPIQPGQKLIIPQRTDHDGTLARAVRDKSLGMASAASQPGSAGASASWAKYRKKPRRKGWVVLLGRKSRWEGQLTTRSGKLRAAAKKAVSRVLATSAGKQTAIHPRLIKLLAVVSDTFGGRTIRIVSGYRLGRTPKTSRHRSGHAIDLRIAGVPVTALRDFVKTFDHVGVGYYPKSKFVHLDVRQQWTFWIDYAGPGQPPQYAGFWTKHSGHEVKAP